MLQKIIDELSRQKQELRKKEMFTLGDLINELEKFPKEWKVYIKPFHLIPQNFTSYRGYYSDLCLTYTTRDESKERTTVGSLLAMAKEVDGKELLGYKGGEFLMNKETPIWVSDSDFSTGVAIASVESYFDGAICINCYQKED